MEYNNLNTPKHTRSAFKSPAPSNRKNNSGFKSPNMLAFNHMIGCGYNLRSSGNKFIDSWFASPVNTRWRDHPMDALNNLPDKDRLFQSSPLMIQQPWPLSSPEFEKQKSDQKQQNSTAPNTAAGQKYVQMSQLEGYHDIRGIQQFIDSPQPCSIIPFNHQEESNLKIRQLLNNSSASKGDKNPRHLNQLDPKKRNYQSQNFSDQYSNSNDLAAQISSIKYINFNPIFNSDSHNRLSLERQILTQKIQMGNKKNSRSYILDENGVLQRIIRKRKRKSNDQLKYLMREFDKNPNWAKETVLEVSRRTGLSEAQVYKWGWDQKKKKFGIDPSESIPFDENYVMESDEEYEVEQLAQPIQSQPVKYEKLRNPFKEEQKIERSQTKQNLLSHFDMLHQSTQREKKRYDCTFKLMLCNSNKNQAILQNFDQVEITKLGKVQLNSQQINCQEKKRDVKSIAKDAQVQSKQNKNHIIGKTGVTSQAIADTNNSKKHSNDFDQRKHQSLQQSKQMVKENSRNNRK